LTDDSYTSETILGETQQLLVNLFNHKKEENMEKDKGDANAAEREQKIKDKKERAE
jgi:hypothetical protein